MGPGAPVARRRARGTSGAGWRALPNDDPEHIEIGAAVSWTSRLGLTPLLESIVEAPLNGGTASWLVAPEVRWEFLPAWETGVAVRVPVVGPEADEEDYRIVVRRIRHFALLGAAPSTDHH